MIDLSHKCGDALDVFLCSVVTHAVCVTCGVGVIGCVCRLMGCQHVRISLGISAKLGQGLPEVPNSKMPTQIDDGWIINVWCGVVWCGVVLCCLHCMQYFDLHLQINPAGKYHQQAFAFFSFNPCTLPDWGGPSSRSPRQCQCQCSQSVIEVPGPEWWCSAWPTLWTAPALLSVPLTEYQTVLPSSSRLS
jgi:hypothetical protein